MTKILPSNMQFSGTTGEFTFVFGKNGQFLRRKRGTVTPAKLNDSLRKNVLRNKPQNRTAVPVNRIMKEYAGYFKEGSFWPRLLSRIKKCADDDLHTHLTSLTGMDLNELHPMSQHITYKPYKIQKRKDHVIVELSMLSHASFRLNKNNCYYLEVILVLWNKQGAVTNHNSISTHWVSFEDPYPEYDLTFRRTAKDSHYLLALRLLGGKDNKTENIMRDKSMIILGGGLL